MFEKLWKLIFSKITYAEYMPHRRCWVRKLTVTKLFNRFVEQEPYDPWKKYTKKSRAIKS